MNHLHIFIGNEFSSFCKEVSQVVWNNDSSTSSYLHMYNVEFESADKIQFKKILYPLPQGDMVTWDKQNTLDANQLCRFWSENIYDQIMRLGTNQVTLNVFLHFSINRRSSYEFIRLLSDSIRRDGRRHKIDFVAYNEDLYNYIDDRRVDFGDEELFYTKRQSLEAIRALQADLEYYPQQNNFIIIQNRTADGFALLNETDGATPLYEMVGCLLPVLRAHYGTIFTNAINVNARDVIGIGISSLYFDKYLFVNYLLQKVFLQAIDNQSVNVEHVDVNVATYHAAEMLKNKSTILSNFLNKYKDAHSSPDYNEICQEVEDILQRVSDYIEKENAMTTKAAVLAAILSQVDCELFDSSFQMLDNQCYEELYAEAINFFITNDEVGYYQICGEKPINSIDELKKINRTLVQTEVQIRTLEKQIETFSSQIELASHVEECFIDDGFFMFKDKKYRLLPDFDEEPLKDSYEPHDVTCESVDLRAQFSSIKDQGQQGSCLSFTLTSIFEYMMKMNLKEDCDLSEAFLYYNARNMDDTGDVDVNTDKGSRFHPSIESLSKYGLALEKYWPYNDQAYTTRPTEQAYEDAATRKLVKALNVDRSVNAIKSALVDGFPVAGSFVLYPSFFTNNGYVSMPTQEEIEERKNDVTEEGKIRHSRHAMVIVGYSDKLQMFIVRNSWGTSWGEKGYCYMPYDYVADPTLFEFACILSEVASLKQPKAAMITVPQLKIDSSDTIIRYYIALASLSKQKTIAKDLREKRAVLQTYLENQKSIYSDSNERDGFIKANVESLQQRNEKLEQENEKLECESIELEESRDKKFKISLLDAIVAVLLSVLLLLSSIIGGNHWILWSVIAALIAFPYMIYVGIMFRKDRITASVKITSAAIVAIVLLPIVVLVEKKFSVWLGSLLVTIPYIAYTVWNYRTYYLDWREKYAEKKEMVRRNKDTIKHNEKRIETLGDHAFAAWQTMNSLVQCQSKLTKIYTNFLNLINNLRIWYKEMTEQNDDLHVDSKFPNYLLLDKMKIDQYFDVIRNTSICEVNLSQKIDEYEISEEYLAKYKQNLKANLANLLIQHIDQIFNISDHFVNDSFSMLAKSVSQNIVDTWCRMADVFIHVNPQLRSDIQSRYFLFAYDLQRLQHQMSQKITNIRPSMQESSDKYKLTLLSIAQLDFEECVMFQNQENKTKK